MFGFVTGFVHRGSKRRSRGDDGRLTAPARPQVRRRQSAPPVPESRHLRRENQAQVPFNAQRYGSVLAQPSFLRQRIQRHVSHRAGCLLRAASHVQFDVVRHRPAVARASVSSVDAPVFDGAALSQESDQKQRLSFLLRSISYATSSGCTSVRVRKRFRIVAMRRVVGVSAFQHRTRVQSRLRSI